jgi:aminoglycoside phosphotransferase family enzyme
VITKNTDPYKIKRCVSCRKDIGLNEKIIQDLYADLKKINQETKKVP